MRTAIRNGSNFWNGGEFHGPPEYNSLVLLKMYLKKYPKRLSREHAPDSRRLIAQLKGRKKIDLFEFGLRDQDVPTKITFGIMKMEYVQTSKIGDISLSEVRAETIHEVVKYTEFSAVEVELSLFSTEEVAQIDAILDKFTPTAECYPAQIPMNT
ncbi:hypothetical protein BBP40_005331 [Aspergillus hancockii]|nr:hypothetical protein BBP40_005331 [Aspergillus hancockii]